MGCDSATPRMPPTDGPAAFVANPRCLATSSPRGLGTGTSQMRFATHQTCRLSGVDIKVAVAHRLVMLLGAAATPTEKEQVERVARRYGAWNVRNDIQVVRSEIAPSPCLRRHGLRRLPAWHGDSRPDAPRCVRFARFDRHFSARQSCQSPEIPGFAQFFAKPSVDQRQAPARPTTAARWGVAAAARLRSRPAIHLPQKGEERVKEVPRRAVGRLHPQRRGIRIPVHPTEAYLTA
jgi:hypothetical protein